MTRKSYSPNTFEFIDTQTPASWMGTASEDCPFYDTQTQSALYADGAWLIKDVTPVIYVPHQISLAQGHHILIIKGKYQEVIDYINSISDPILKLLAENAFYRTNPWSLDSPFLIQTATELGFLENLNDWFVEGSLIIL